MGILFYGAFISFHKNISKLHTFLHPLFGKLRTLVTFARNNGIMRVNFYLPRKSEAALIYCVCTFDGRRIKFSTGKRVSPSCWSESKHRVVGANSVNACLQHIEDVCYKVYSDLEQAGEVMPEEFKEIVMDTLSGKKTGGALLLPYYERWSETKTLTKTPNAQGRLSYRKIAEYANPKTRFSDVTKKWIESYLLYLEGHGYTVNYIGTQLKNLKAVMNRAHEEGLHENMDYKKFKRMEEDADAIYLNKDEIEMLEDCVLTGRQEAAARDLFLVGYYTAMRFSDYSQLSVSDIVDGKLRVATQKTGEQVVIPANPKLVAILERYGGRAPRMQPSEFNMLIKFACREAGITTVVPHTITRGGKKETEYLPKYELVTSHTARRSGATNMILSGLREDAVMMITGHRTSAAFRRYIRITKEENADMLSSSDFFKG